MKKMMLIDATHKDEELRIALVDGKLLDDLVVEPAEKQQITGNIYLGTITSVEPSLNAVFVNYGGNRHGFLPLKEISRDYFLKPVKEEELDTAEEQEDPKAKEETSDEDKSEQRGKRRPRRNQPDIKELVKEGMQLLIQVEKEERGTKGAALTTFISLAGSYLVLMPNNPRAGGISRRIEGDERDELREKFNALKQPDDMGVIIRTAGVNKSNTELQWDLDVLVRHWEAIQQAAKESKAPKLIHQESEIVTRTIRDCLRHDISEIVTDDKEIFEKVQQYLGQVSPQFKDAVRLYEDSTPLFTHYKIEHQIESAYQRNVTLPSGGSIVIDHTEALVAIDINSSRATKGGDIEETALQTNIEAAEEIARQLRLRDIGGLVVIDFIDMTPVKNQRTVENHLRDALKLDRARVQVGRISRFGMLEMSRQRLRSSLREGMQAVCPRCNGQGTIRGVESLGLSILRILEEDAFKERIMQVQVQLPLDVSTFLLNEKRDVLNRIESEHGLEVLLVPNPNLQTPQYQIKRIQGERGNDELAEKRGMKSSHELIQSPEVKMPAGRSQRKRAAEQPAVKSVYSHAGRKPSSGGLFKRIFGKVFSSEEEETTPKKKPHHHRRRSSGGNSGGQGQRRGGRKPGGGQRKKQGGHNKSGGQGGRSRSRSSGPGNKGGRGRPRSQSRGPKPKTGDNKKPGPKKPSSDKPVVVRPTDKDK